MKIEQQAKALLFDLVLSYIDDKHLKEFLLNQLSTVIKHYEDLETHKHLCDILKEFESVKNLSVKDVIDIQNVNEALKKIDVFYIKNRLLSLAEIKN